MIALADERLYAAKRRRDRVHRPTSHVARSDAVARHAAPPDRRLRDRRSPASARPRPGRLSPGPWPEPLPLADSGLGLDSLEQFGAIGAIADAFGLDDAALSAAAPVVVGDWLDAIECGGGTPDHLTIATSGSTGTARAVTQAVADLHAEASSLAGLFADRRRIVALVPGHHLYGLIWTILLSDVLRISIVAGSIGGSLDLRAGANGRLKAFVVPDAGISPEAPIRTLERTAAERLSGPERPRAFAFAPALPRNAMGKPVEWS